MRFVLVASVWFLVADLVLGACTRSDPHIIEIAKSLVPEGSQVIEIGENMGLAIEVGDYSATLRIDDGGLGPGLLEAIEDQAAADHWEERYRCEVLDGVTLGYSRDEFKVDVSVLVNEEPVYAYISIQRIGDGNAWPPEC